MEGQPTEFEPVPMDSEDDLFIAYTSGTTNNPRRIVHSQAGYLLYAAFTHKVLLQLLQGFSPKLQDKIWHGLGLRLFLGTSLDISRVVGSGTAGMAIAIPLF